MKNIECNTIELSIIGIDGFFVDHLRIDHETIVSTEQLGKGIYIVKIEDGKTVRIQKLIVN